LTEANALAYPATTLVTKKKVFNNGNWFRGSGWPTGRQSKTDTQTASAPTHSSLLSGGHLSMFQKTLFHSLDVLVIHSKMMFLVVNQVFIEDSKSIHTTITTR
jgi:hypothetical protein